MTAEIEAEWTELVRKAQERLLLVLEALPPERRGPAAKAVDVSTFEESGVIVRHPTLLGLAGDEAVELPDLAVSGIRLLTEHVKQCQRARGLVMETNALVDALGRSPANAEEAVAQIVDFVAAIERLHASAHASPEPSRFME